MTAQPLITNFAKRLGRGERFLRAVIILVLLAVLFRNSKGSTETDAKILWEAF